MAIVVLVFAINAFMPPVLVLQPAAKLRQGTAEAAALLNNAPLVDLPDFEYGFFGTHPEQIATRVLEFLDKE